MSKSLRNWTNNDAIEMMHSNTSDALRAIVETIKKEGYSKKEIIELLIEMSDLLEAQAITVSLRSELGYENPINDKKQS